MINNNDLMKWRIALDEEARRREGGKKKRRCKVRSSGRVVFQGL